MQKKYQIAAITGFFISLALNAAFLTKPQAPTMPQNDLAPTTATESCELDAPVKTERKTTPPSVKVASGSSGLPSQFQKDATATACAHAHEKHQIDLDSANISRELYMTTCYTDLLSIAYHESRFNNNAIGDGGQSRGAFQIYRKAHPHITDEQAFDYVFAVNWTLDNLHNHGYPTMRSFAIKSHNGLGGNGSYETAVKATSERFLAMGL